MRRNAGAYLRYKSTMLLLLLAAGGGIIVGLGLGYVLHQMMGVWLDGVSTSVAMGGAILVVIAAFWIVFRSVERERLQRLEKGESAEVRTGQTIEYAITAPNCAVAHSVTDIARVRRHRPRRRDARAPVGYRDEVPARPARPVPGGTSPNRGQHGRGAQVGTAGYAGVRLLDACLRITNSSQELRSQQGADRCAHTGHARTRNRSRGESAADARQPRCSRGMEARPHRRIVRTAISPFDPIVFLVLIRLLQLTPVGGRRHSSASNVRPDVDDTQAPRTGFDRPVEVNSDRGGRNLAVPETNDVASAFGVGKREAPGPLPSGFGLVREPGSSTCEESVA